MANLYKMFVSTDATMLEVNPLAETPDGRVIVCDAKINFDDNAAFRHSDIFAFRDTTQVRCLRMCAIELILEYLSIF